MEQFAAYYADKDHTLWLDNPLDVMDESNEPVYDACFELSIEKAGRDYNLYHKGELLGRAYEFRQREYVCIASNGVRLYAQDTLYKAIKSLFQYKYFPDKCKVVALIRNNKPVFSVHDYDFSRGSEFDRAYKDWHITKGISDYPQCNRDYRVGWIIANFRLSIPKPVV